jgi:hypothetical protein
MFREYLRFVLVWIALLLLLAGHQIAQGAIINNVYICVEPEGREPYFIQFGQSNRFGFIVPQNAPVTLYRPSATEVSATLYSVIPDVKIGTYKIGDKVSQALTVRFEVDRSTDTSNFPCDAFFSDFAEPIWRISPPIAPPMGVVEPGKLHMLMIDLGGVSENETLCPEDTSTTEITCPVVMGVFSVHIRPEVSNPAQYQRDFQIAQFDEGEIDIRFPFLTDTIDTRKVRIIVVGTKSFEIQRQFPTKASWITKTSADDRLDFIDGLGVEPLTANQPDVPLDLVSLMEEGNVQVYPEAGLVYDYPNGGFVRLKLDEKPSARNESETSFEINDCISPLDGIDVPYYPEPDFGKHENRGGILRSATPDIAKINEIRENNLLIVETSIGKFAIGSWLVQTVDCP